MADSAAEFVEQLLPAALDAARRVLHVARGDIAIDLKHDGSPATEADRQAEAILLKALETAYKDIPVVAEESVADGHVPAEIGDKFALVDPLDGTKEFIAGRPDYTVNVALIKNSVPIAGIVIAPARKTAWSGSLGSAPSAKRMVLDADMNVSKSEPITVSVCAERPRLVISRLHQTKTTQDFVARVGACETLIVGSSLKFCLLAEGACDVYPRFGPTNQWDTAAGDAVLRAAGGMTWAATGGALSYGRTERADAPFANPDFIAAAQDTDLSAFGVLTTHAT
ncbi:MAG: 3'(2'),5'-bisphosphate nucleotidase CysQ [Pseudomonadota bacterium]